MYSWKVLLLIYMPDACKRRPDGLPSRTWSVHDKVHGPAARCQARKKEFTIAHSIWLRQSTQLESISPLLCRAYRWAPILYRYRNHEHEEILVHGNCRCIACAPQFLSLMKIALQLWTKHHKSSTMLVCAAPGASRDCLWGTGHDHHQMGDASQRISLAVTILTILSYRIGALV